MAVSLKHAFVSAVPDGGDPTIVQPSNWNAEHALEIDTGKLLGRTTSGTGPVEEIAIDALPFSQAGTGAALRTWQNKLREAALSIMDFGAIGDGTAHPLSERYGSLGAAQVDYPFVSSTAQLIDWAAIVAAYTYVVGEGGGTIGLPRGKYVIGDTLAIVDPGVFWVGEGAVYTDETTTPAIARANSATQIIWDASATPAAMVDYSPDGPDDDTADISRGGGMRGVLLDASDTATACLRIISWSGLTFDNVVGIEADGVGYNLGTYTAGATPGKYSNSYHTFNGCHYLSGGNGSVPLAMWGYGGIYNSCFSRFVSCNLRGSTISIGDADSNFFIACAWGATLRLESDDSSAYSSGSYLAARNNVFFGSHGAITAKAHTGGGAGSSYGNMVIGHQMDSGAALPTVESGARLLVMAALPNGSLPRAGAITYGGNPAGCGAALSSAQTISDATTTAIAWPSPSFDPLGCYSGGSPTRLTIPNGIGFARFTGGLDWASSGDGERYADILKSGSVAVARTATWPVISVSQGQTLDTGWISVTPGDYFELRAFQSSGAGLDLAAFSTFFSVDFK